MDFSFCRDKKADFMGFPGSLVCSLGFGLLLVCGSPVFKVGLVCSGSGYIMMFWFKRVGLGFCGRVSGRHSCTNWRVWMFVFFAGAAADASRLLFHVSGCELNPEIWEEVPPNVAPASAAKEHPTPFLRVKISLFSYANEFLFRVGVAEGAQLLRCGLESVLGF